MLQFLKFVLATIVGFILLFFIAILFLAAIVSSTSSKEIKINENSVLKLELDEPIMERTSNDPFSNFNFASFDMDIPVGLNDIIKSINFAKTDDNIKGIYINTQMFSCGLATATEIRDALEDFKTSGKFIIAFADSYSQRSYYLASVSDQIYLQPEGLLEFKGLAAQLMFYKNAMEKLGIEPQVIREGKYKSAIEPFILDQMSESNREQIKELVDDFWNYVVNEISISRSIDASTLMRIADGLEATTAEGAFELNLVDGLKYEDEITAILLDKIGSTDDKVNSVEISEYKKSIKNEKGAYKKDKIAIVYAEGEILYGDQPEGNIGSDNIAKAIKQAAKDSKVKAIVLRINSPGGSSLASDIIWREVELAKEKKPVVVSMGNLAASGGYYIACPANSIVAQPTTLTGSIGVWGLLFNGKELLNEKLGITTDGYKSGRMADIGTFARAMTEEEKAVIQKITGDVYNDFLDHVAEGRQMAKSDVDTLGQGRIWSGMDALDNGLVDRLGGTQKALEIAAKLAEIEDYTIKELPAQEEPLVKIMKQLENNASAKLLKQQVGPAYPYVKALKDINDIKGVQMRLPFYLEIY